MGSHVVKRTTVAGLLLGLAVLIALVARQGMRDVLAVFAVGGWKLLLLLPLHLLPLVFDAAAWRLLVEGPRGLARLCTIAWIRQAVNRLLPFFSVGGEIVGVRLLIQAGAQAPSAVASVVVEVFTTIVAQFLLVLLGTGFVIELADSRAVLRSIVYGLAAGLAVICVLLVILRRGRLFARLHQAAFKLAGRQPAEPGARQASERIDARIISLLKDAPRLSASVALQLAGMVVGSLEAWAVFVLLGGHISWQQALIVEVLNQTAKHIFFFIPGALGVQELSFVTIAPFLGVPTDLAIAASLAKRAVDVITGVPAVIWWQWGEGQRLIASKDVFEGS